VIGSLHVAELEQASLDLIECTQQPGRLRISRQACTLRFLMAQKGKPEFSNDEFGMARKAGLDICRNCAEGRVRAKVRRRK
jgi:hypothetical protein